MFRTEPGPGFWFLLFMGPNPAGNPITPTTKRSCSRAPNQARRGCLVSDRKRSVDQRCLQEEQPARSSGSTSAELLASLKRERPVSVLLLLLLVILLFLLFFFFFFFYFLIFALIISTVTTAVRAACQAGAAAPPAASAGTGV